MKPIKKFSTEMNQPKSILESLDSKALDELIKGMGFKDVHELKREKNLLSKLEALLKEVNPKQNISEDDAEDIEDDINKKGEPKSLEDLEGKKEPETPIGKPEEIKEDESDDHEETEEESDEDENHKEDSNKTEIEVEVEVEDSDKEEESVSTPKATRRIMTFEDFIQEETVNKNVSYRDDEDEEDEALPVADSKETDIEVEENANVQTKTVAVKSFSQFVSEAVADLGPELKDEELDYEGAIVVPVAKGDGPKTADEIEEEEVEAGKPKPRDEKEGEVLVTVDQEITEEPKTSEDEVDTHSTVVVGESIITEADVKSDEDFKEYAFTVLQNAFGDEFDETKAQELVDGLTSKYSGDYGAMVGALKASLGK